MKYLSVALVICKIMLKESNFRIFRKILLLRRQITPRLRLGLVVMNALRSNFTFLLEQIRLLGKKVFHKDTHLAKSLISSFDQIINGNFNKSFQLVP